MAVIGDEKLQSFLDGLHAKSREQTALIQAFEARRNDAELPPGADEIKAFRSDKLVALDRNKAEFCYQLCRAKKASKVIEVGTSYGVSTIYLAAAVRENARSYGVDGIVIGTEYEPKKAEAARANFATAGVSQFIELREGDLRETLKRIDGPVDFVLMDVWIAMARSAIELIAPHLSEGAIVVCDNTLDHRAFYADYFAFLNDPANRFTTMTLPFQGAWSYRFGAESDAREDRQSLRCERDPQINVTQVSRSRTTAAWGQKRRLQTMTMPRRARSV